MFTIGIDYGTNSVRALVVRVRDGAEFGTGVVDYPSGHQGVLLDPKDHHLARQSPADYLFGLKESEVEALRHGNYFAWDVYNADRDGVGRCVDELVDGTFARLSGNFESIQGVATSCVIEECGPETALSMSPPLLHV